MPNLEILYREDLGQAWDIAIQVNASNIPFILFVELKILLDRMRSRFAAELNVG